MNSESLEDESSLPNFSKLSLDALLWSGRRDTGFTVSYFDVIRQLLNEDKKEEMAKEKGKRPRASDEAQDFSQLRAENDAHLLWLRLCNVPSVPSGKGTDGTVVGLGTENQAIWTPRANKVNEDLRLMRISEPRRETRDVRGEVTRSIFNDVVVLVNKEKDAKRLAPPFFRSLNSGRRVHEDAFVQWLHKNAKNDSFTAQQLPDRWEVSHVVPQSSMALTKLLDEFSGALGDPTNIVLSRPEHNAEWGTKAVYLKASMWGRHHDDGVTWAPNGFEPKRRAAIARAVACCALTYPLVGAETESLMLAEVDERAPGRMGMPHYSAQIDTIMELLSQPPDPVDVERSFMEFAFFGWCNPLTLSTKVRTLVKTPGHPLHQLLKSRLNGTDRGSNEVLRAVRAIIVASRQP